MSQSLQHDIEAIADGLSASADALHTRLVRLLRQRDDERGQPGAPLISQAAMQALFDNEIALRQRAGSLHLEAAVVATTGLGGAQQQLLDVVARARRTIDKVDRVKELIELTGELLALGAALASGKPERLATPYEKVKHHLEALDLLE
ncbi:MAG: hypothetical protein ABW202_13200 [Duganella sp.]